MDLSDYLDFAKNTLNIQFKDINLLVTAFTHRSYLNEHRKAVREHNERLEFLGDAVLELVVTEYLFRNYNQASEGLLTNWRSSLVRTESISRSADKLNFRPLLRLSKGEKHGSDRGHQQILANTYEAVIGAIYLDGGYQAAQDFINRSLLNTFQDILATGSWLDPKSRLQEIIQEKLTLTPEYRLLIEDGPDHEKTFTIGVYVEKQMLGSGNGPSKQAAQQAAASDALNKLRLDDFLENLEQKVEKSI